MALVHPLGKVGKPDDVGNAIAFLASDMSTFISGETLFIDGGRRNVSSGVATQLKKDWRIVQWNALMWLPINVIKLKR